MPGRKSPLARAGAACGGGRVECGWCRNGSMSFGFDDRPAGAREGTFTVFRKLEFLLESLFAFAAGLTILAFSGHALVERHDRLSEKVDYLIDAARDVVAVANDPVRAENGGALIQSQGFAQGEGALTDPLFDIRVEALVLRRVDEMYTPTHWEVEKVLASSVAMDSCWEHGSRWIFEHDGTGGADRVGSRRLGRASSGAAWQCARAAGSGNELLASRGGTFARRRYGSHVVPALPGRRDQGVGRVRLRGRQLSSEPRAAGAAYASGEDHGRLGFLLESVVSVRLR